MGQLFSDVYDGPSTSVGVSRRLPNISISANSTPDQIACAIERLNSRCVRLKKLQADAEALKAEEDEEEETTETKRQTLVNELAGSIKSLQADIVRERLSFFFGFFFRLPRDVRVTVLLCIWTAGGAEATPD